MSGEYLAQSKHQISTNRLHKNVLLRIGFRRRTFLCGRSAGDNLYQDTR